jgi:ribosome biogenesis ATPase
LYAGCALFFFLNGRKHSGRLDKLLYVPLPTPEDRVSILKALATTINLSSDVDLTEIGISPRADGYSGADCAALLREAGLAVLKEDVDRTNAVLPLSTVEDGVGTGMDVDITVGPTLCISSRHFVYAFNHVVPSVSRKDQARYNKMRDRMAHARSRGAVLPELAVDEVDAVDTTKKEVPNEDANDDPVVNDGNESTK